MSYTFPCGIRATANDGAGAAFLGSMLLRDLRERRAEQEAQFFRMLSEAPQEDGWRTFHEFDYTPEFHEWLHARIPDGWEMWTTRSNFDMTVRVAMRRTVGTHPIPR